MPVLRLKTEALGRRHSVLELLDLTRNRRMIGTICVCQVRPDSDDLDFTAAVGSQRLTHQAGPVAAGCT